MPMSPEGMGASISQINAAYSKLEARLSYLVTLAYSHRLLDAYYLAATALWLVLIGFAQKKPKKPKKTC